MKKIILTIFIGLLLIGFVIAGITLNKILENKEVDRLDKELLDAVGMTGMNISELSCDEDTCDPVIFKTSYGTMKKVIIPYHIDCTLYEVSERKGKLGECLERTKILYTDNELSAQIDKIADDYLERILKRLRINKEMEEDIKEPVVAEKEIKITQRR